MTINTATGLAMFPSRMARQRLGYYYYHPSLGNSSDSANFNDHSCVPPMTPTHAFTASIRQKRATTSWASTKTNPRRCIHIHMGASSFPLTCFERDKDVSSDGHAQNRHYSNERRNKIKFNYHINHRCFVSSSSSSNSKKDPTTKKNEKQDGRNFSVKGKKTVNTQSILEQMRSIPNLITMSRIVSAPGLAALIVMDQYEWALGGVVIFGFTDWLDGYLARNYDMRTVLGTYLDPLADKIMVNTLALSLCYQDLLPMPLVGLWLGRDVALCIGTYYFNSKMTKSGESVIDPARTPLEIEPSFTSKVNTVLQFVTLAAAMTEPLSGLSHDIVIKLCWLTAGTTAASGLSYIDGKSMITSGNFRLKGGLGGTTKPDHKKTPQNSIEKKEGPR